MAAHRAARAGRPIEVAPRQVTVEAIELVSLSPADGQLDVRLDIRCGAGTYIRAIARDLGEALGCGGYLGALRRTEAAGLRADDGIGPERLEALAAEGRLGEAIQPVGDLLPLPRVTLDADGAWPFLHGSSQPMADLPDGRAVIYRGGELLGIGRIAAGRLQPEKVVASGAGE
jgi:tRNA pseudouridine55 synthase